MAIVRSSEAKGTDVKTVIMMGPWSENLLKQLRQLPQNIIIKDIQTTDYNCLAFQHEKVGITWELIGISKISPKAQRAFALFASHANLVLLCPESGKHADKLAETEGLLAQLTATAPLKPGITRSIVRWHATPPKEGYSAILTPLVLPDVPKESVSPLQRKKFLLDMVQLLRAQNLLPGQEMKTFVLGKLTKPSPICKDFLESPLMDRSILRVLGGFFSHRLDIRHGVAEPETCSDESSSSPKIPASI